MSDEHQPSEKRELDLDAVDQEIRINELTEQAKEMGLGESHVSPDCPPEVHEQFLQSMIAYESAPESTHMEELEKSGGTFPAAEEMDDATLHTKLWELINMLAMKRTFLHNTDHLSDRELYMHLWKESLREWTVVMPPSSGWAFHIDTLGSGSDEDIDLMFRFYSHDDEDRARWMRDFPDYVMPPKEKPAFDRDRLLPKDEMDIPYFDSDEEEQE